MRLNADIGEGFGHWKAQHDALIMPLIDDANIACGYHAGDPVVMNSTLALAKQHNVNVGAHVSYPDLQGFGRRSMVIASNDLILMIQAQIATLEGMARCQQICLSYVKPHGALYNDMMRDSKVYDAVLLALANYHTLYPLVIQGMLCNNENNKRAKAHGIKLVYEGFADRAYDDKGFLVSRHNTGAVLNNQQASQQASKFINKQAITSVDGSILALKVDTLCVHGDTTSALELCKKIRRAITVFDKGANDAQTKS